VKDAASVFPPNAKPARIINIAKSRRTAPDRVFCWIPLLEVSSAYLDVIEQLWPRMCDGFRVVSKEGDIREGIIPHHYLRQDKHDLWNQVHRGWARVAEMFLEDYDWFVKLDYDSFFIPSNLLWLTKLKEWTPESDVYFGHLIFEQSRPINQPRAQFNLGAGYGVSRGLLRKVYPFLPTAKVESGASQKQNPGCEEKNRWGEDYRFADCLRAAVPNLIPNSTLDPSGRETFLPFTPNLHIHSSMPDWMIRGKTSDALRRQKHTYCCSSRQALWHKAFPDFHWLYYLHMEAAVDPVPTWKLRLVQCHRLLNRQIFGDGFGSNKTNCVIWLMRTSRRSAYAFRQNSKILVLCIAELHP
jgi:hypothetical protein